MSTVKLDAQNEVDPEQIASATLEEKGAKISAQVVSVASGDWQDLRVPEDMLVIRLKDGGEFAIRGSEAAKRAWDLLQTAKKQSGASFEMGKNSAS